MTEPVSVGGPRSGAGASATLTRDPAPVVTTGPVLGGVGAAPGIRWREGERLEQIFEERVDWLERHGLAGQLAVDGDDVRLTYRQLDARANQLARHLLASRGPPRRPGRAAVRRRRCSYAAMLAVLKLHAAYVPLDAGFPADRLAYILADAEVRLVLTLSHLAALRRAARRAPGGQPRRAGRRAGPAEPRATTGRRGRAPPAELAYIIYTSGSTGRPKGVAVEHASICNFVRVAAEVYGVRQQDRMYQGMTIAFDFSVEEIWVALAVGATLVPRPAGSALLGADLREFLDRQRVTALCCVPTLLATLDEDLPRAALPAGLRRGLPAGPGGALAPAGRRFLNVYGPTEATVTATWAAAGPATGR